MHGRTKSELTCWLAAEGCALVADELGIDLKILRREYTSGRYSLDILAAEVSDKDNERAKQNRLVVISDRGRS